MQVVKDNNHTNTNFSITLDAIYLEHLDNKKGWHECMHLKTVQVITFYNVKDVPVTGLVIKYAEEMASEQGIKTLKIQGENKVPLHPVDWISWVDYYGETYD